MPAMQVLIHIFVSYREFLRGVIWNSLNLFCKNCSLPFITFQMVLYYFQEQLRHSLPYT